MKNNLLYNLLYKVARIPLIKPILLKLDFLAQRILMSIQVSMLYRRCARKYTSELEQNYDNKTILFIFAGRKDRMSLGLRYIDVLLKKKSIDEVHIWGFARNEADTVWIKGLDTKKYKLFFIQPLRNKIEKFPAKLFKCVYKFYSEPVFDQAIFIKMDDDIVFIDTHKFDIFLKQLKNLNRQRTLCLSANVLNNGVCDHYKQKAGLIPDEVANLEFPNEHGKGSAEHEYWEHGAKSKRLHQFFLDNVARFLKPDLSISPTTAVPISTRVSINFVGFSDNNCFKRYSQSWDMRVEHYMSDEHYFTTLLSQQLDRNVLIVNDFMVSHLSFVAQKKCQNDTDIIEGYEKLQTQVFDENISENHI